MTAISPQKLGELLETHGAGLVFVRQTVVPIAGGRRAGGVC